MPPPRRPGPVAIRLPPRASGSADASRRPQAESSPRGGPGPVCSQPGRADRRAGTRRCARPSGEGPGQSGADSGAGDHPRKGPSAPPRDGARRAGRVAAVGLWAALAPGRKAYAARPPPGPQRGRRGERSPVAILRCSFGRALLRRPAGVMAAPRALRRPEGVFAAPRAVRRPQGVMAAMGVCR